MKIKRFSLNLVLWLLLFSFSVFAQEGLIETLKFKDANIRLVLQAIAQKATKEGKKVNIIVTPEVEGLVTMDLESVDWETALKVVLKTYGYGYVTYKDIIIVASPERIKETEIKEQERQAVESPQIKIFKLKYIDANDAKKAIEPLLSRMGKVSVLEATGQAGWEFGTDPTKRVRAKEGKLSRTNLLVVLDITKKIDEISTLIEKIDVMPKQILIKARIMEVNRDLLRDIGFDWGTGATGAESSTMLTTPVSKRRGLDVAQVAGHILAPTPSAFIPETTDLTAANAGLKLLFKRVSGAQFEIILHALEEDLRTNTLSAPIILTLNNQEAGILVGTKFPIIETTVSTETSNIVGGTLKEYKDIGIQLSVVPQIWGEKDEFINMIIHPAVTSYSTTSKVKDASGNTLVEYPIVSSREAETQMVVKDGETIVMGGLLKDVKTKQEIGVPFLSKIPLIGWIFKRDTLDTEKIDLLIFITAKIVKPGEIIPQEIVNTGTLNSEFEKK
jgi:type IV pilus assembly protein PilQ